MSAPAPTARRRAGPWTSVAVSGGILLALSSVGLLPMVREGLAVRKARAIYELERLEPTEGADGPAVYYCGGRTVALEDEPWPGPGDGGGGRRVVVRIGAVSEALPAPVRLQDQGQAVQRYATRVVPFRWEDRREGRSECGVAVRLPTDAEAVARARAGRSSTLPGFLLEEIRGVRPPHLRGLRFRVLRWSRDDPAVRHRDFAFSDWDGDPYGVFAANLLGGAVGLHNQSLSYWPSLLFPVLYPFGLAVLGGTLLLVGVLGRLRRSGR